jgi:hypothetical protein
MPGVLSTMRPLPREGHTIQEDFDDYLVQVYLKAKRAFPRDPNGLLGYILPAAEYLRLTNPAPAGPFVLPEHPGVSPIGGNGLKLYQFRFTEWLDFTTAVSTFSGEIIDSWNPVVTSRAQGVAASMETVALPVAIARLRAAYGVVTPAQMVSNHATLMLPFNPPSDMAAHILAHSTAHRFAAKHGQPYSCAQSVQHFKESVATCGLFTMTLAIWEAAFPTMVLQTWDSITDAIFLASTNLSAASAASRGYALSVAAAPAHAASASSMEVLLAENRALRLAAAARAGARSGARTGARVGTQAVANVGGRLGAGAVAAPSSGRRGRPATLSPNTASGGAGLFCWSHTSQGHVGADCTDEMPGHEPDATWHNRMGSPCH